MDRHHAMQLIFARAGSNVIPNHRHLGPLEFDEDNVHIPEDPEAWNVLPGVLMMAALAVFAGFLFWTGILMYRWKDKPRKNIQGSFSRSYVERDEEDDHDLLEDNTPLLGCRKT